VPDAVFEEHSARREVAQLLLELSTLRVRDHERPLSLDDGADRE
jgi:hypothetical protein